MNEKAMSAFQTLKRKLIEPPILGFPDLDQPFCLYTDCSADSVGAVL
jgi:hypothetical protein